MSVFKQLDKDNLHHAYLIEGAQEEVLPALLEFLEDAGVATRANSDFMHISVDAFKMEDARNLKAYEKEKGFSTDKKIFVISANSILLEAQNTLLKVFEEPIPNTHFFVIVPDTNALLKTLVSRFYLISTRQDLVEFKDIDKFTSMPLNARINFMKDFLAEEDIVQIDSIRAKSLRFLNALEFTLHKKFISKGIIDTSFFNHFFKVREILRMPGSSVKNLLESVALITPVIQ